MMSSGKTTECCVGGYNSIRGQGFICSRGAVAEYVMGGALA